MPVPLPPEFGHEWELDAEPVLLEPVADVPSPVVTPIGIGRRSPPSADREPPADPDRIVEAFLFVGGPPVTAAVVAASIRGFGADRLRETVDRLNRAYRGQRRPYHIIPVADGYTLVLRPVFQALRSKLIGSPREARLTQPALDVLSQVAYRQPIAKGSIDAARGADSGSVLRQLVRLGLIIGSRGATGADSIYTTTPRFLELFGLTSLDDLPRLAEGGAS